MNCINCGQSMQCKPEGECWCFEYPYIISVDNEDKCLCRVCLQRKMAKSINSKDYQLSMKDQEKIKNLGIPTTLTENIDYYINENGLYTFTTWYLLRRGYCCENKCKNCPY